MELFIHGLVPGLVLILLAVALSFFALPMLAPAVLLGGTCTLLAIALYIHWSKFGRDEYKSSALWYNAKDYLPLIMIAVIIIGCALYWAMNKAASSGASPALLGGYFGPSNMSEISMPAFGGGLMDIAMTAGSRIQSLLKKGRLPN
jgi:hypothetical protein